MDKPKKICTAAMKIARFPSLSACPCLIANGGIKRLTPFAATVSALANLHILILAKLRCALSDVQCAQLPQQLMLCLAVVFGSSPGSLMAADDERQRQTITQAGWRRMDLQP